MEQDKYKSVETIELFGKEYIIESCKNGYIKLKHTDIFIRGGLVYTARGNTPLSLAQTDKIRHKMVRVVENDERSPEQRKNEDLVNMFKEE